MTQHPPRCDRFKFAKASYRSKAAANKAPINMDSRNAKSVDVFQCRWCGLWHLTSQPQKDAKRAA